MNEDKIKQEAKKIMDNFMKALDKIEIEEEFLLERKENFREESKEKTKTNQSFKQSFLSNANKTKGDAILANKGAWVD